MWGLRGSPRRRRLIRAEFYVGAVGCLLLGAFVLARAGSTLWTLVGIWLIGAGVNYVPLALYAERLSRPGALEAELAGIELRRELRRAGAQQFWIAVPGAIAVRALRK